MGNPYSRPEDRLRHISREVNSLRSSLRTSSQNLTRDKKEIILSNLAHHSSEVSSMHGKIKRKQLESTLKNISDTMEQVFKIEPSLDGGAVESDSFVNVPLGRRANSLGSLRSSGKKNLQKQVSAEAYRGSVPTLRNIEAKYQELKTQIATAIDNKDSKLLKVHQQTIKVLAGDLEMIRIEKDTPLEKRKESIDKKIVIMYQKVNRALNEFKKNELKGNQNKQQRKLEAMRELADIEMLLAENESLLDKLVKEKNSSDFATIRNNIIHTNQRLAKVDIVDNEVQEKVVLLSQKITETVKSLDKIMAKKEFEFKISKSIESFERILRNFDPKTNGKESIQSLQGIRNSMEHLEEINDSSKARKRQLLQSIDQQITTLTRSLDQASDKEIIDQIVEDNVILRKKAKSGDTEHTVIDQFINYWNNIKNNFDVNSYSNLSLLRIDSVLEEMQQSIYDIRVGIASKCDLEVPYSLSKRHSQSVPRLNTRKSLEQVDNKIIKTKAKIYNMSTPNLQHVENQQPNSRFSKIEEIKLQVNYIKEKINGSPNKSILRTKLEQYRIDLEQFVKDTNKTVATNAILVSNQIVEMLHELVLLEFKERIETLFKRVQHFNGSRYDKEYADIKNDLANIQMSLENFNIPEQFEGLQVEKGELLEDINSNLEHLDERSNNYRRYECENVKQIKEQLQQLNEKVKRFSGTYKSVLYNSIERELNRLLTDVLEQVEDKTWSDEITKETERLLKILEQRSSLAQSFKSNDTKLGEQAGMSKIKNDLFNIKREIDRTAENDVKTFIGLQSRLDLVNLELSRIASKSNENLEKEKEIVANETQTLKNVVDAKVALSQQPMVQWPQRALQGEGYPRSDVLEKIEEVERAFATLKEEIHHSSMEQDIHKYYKLTQDIKTLEEKLTSYKFIRGTDLCIRQMNLLTEMQYYITALEKEALDIDYLVNMERKLDSIRHLFDSKGQQDLKTMAKELQGIQKKLEEHNFKTSNENLRTRKSSVQQKTEGLVQKLKTMQVAGKDYKMDDIEKQVGSLATKVTSFVGSRKDKRYYELNEAVMNLIVHLEKSNYDQLELQQRKAKLLKDLHALGQILDDRATQTQSIVHIEQEIDKVSTMIDRFKGNQEDLDEVRTKMEDIKKKIQALRFAPDFVSRKNACVEKLSALFNKSMLLTPKPLKSKASLEYGASDFTLDDQLEKIKRDVDQVETLLQGRESSGYEELQKHDEALVMYTKKINELGITKDSPKYAKVLKLYDKIENLTDAIDDKIQDFDKLAGISADVDQISQKMDTPLNYDQINKLDERLIHLQVSLGKMVNPELKAQIDACMLRIILCLQKIADFRASVHGTSV
ncbi:uncharacterized protein LOC126738251 [Anthonomus grandis grandis]|uniref:uncharacterized protein LOC126738251 n=1 Tax=Anthonomus grandis grandis TaxID=2921223 RepID=UPI002165F5BB|nr:uncharacterized protein LOC126738251 [Anthonomus grandis grandis]